MNLFYASCPPHSQNMNEFDFRVVFSRILTFFVHFFPFTFSFYQLMHRCSPFSVFGSFKSRTYIFFSSFFYFLLTFYALSRFSKLCPIFCFRMFIWGFFFCFSASRKAEDQVFVKLKFKNSVIRREHIS